MKCQVCGAESGKYPLCRSCNELKEQGIVIKCEKCHRWHYKNMPCPMENNFSAVPLDNQINNIIPEEKSEEIPKVPAVESIESDKPYLYEAKKTFITKIEGDFYKAIIASVPNGFFVFPQANLASFIIKKDRSHYQNELYRNVDFLITDSFYAPKIAVEINDRSHMEAKRQERDKKVHNILEEAGIPMLTLWTSYGVNKPYIKERIDTLLNTPIERKHHFEEQENKPKPEVHHTNNFAPKKQGCYIATCVYGSYDCSEVWTLRRFRDEKLASTSYGRMFIKIYYAVSPKLVKWFGNVKIFRNVCRGILDRFVHSLNEKGFDNTPYSDK